MYVAILALLSCAGAWSVWRHHPLYSVRSTLRVGGELLLMVGAAICLFVITIRLVDGYPQTVQIASVLAVVVLATIGLILGIMRITTPATARVHAPLPTQTQVTSHRRALLPWAKVAAAFFVVCGLLALIPGPVRYITGSVALIGALLSCVLFPIGYVAARQQDVTVTGLLLNPWLHWQYPSDQWLAWSATLVERLQAQPATFVLQRNWRRLVGLSAVLLAATCLIGPGPLWERVGWGLACIGLVATVIELAAWDAKRTPQRLARHLQSAPPEAWFGEAGLLCGSDWFPWLDQSVYLTDAALDTRAPRSILFCFDRLVPAAYGSPGLVHVRQNVLIPADASATDLALLQSALTRRCPAARIALA